MVNIDEYKPFLIFITAGDYVSLLEKGVAFMISERDEGGFFKKVFNVHPYASKTQTLFLNETHQLVEFGPSYPFPFLNFKFGRVVNSFLRPFLIIKALTGLVRRENIDVIRATDPYGCGFYAWAISKLTGVPFCVSIHADYEKCYRLAGREEGVPFLERIFEKFVLPRAKLVMPISEYLGSLLAVKGIPRQSIRLIPHGINVNRFLSPKAIDLSDKFSIPADKKILCMVGRLSRQKYVYHALEVVRRLAPSRNDFILIFVGDGEEKDGLQSLVAKENLSSIVRIVGFQTNENVAAILRKSFLVFSLLAGLALIEASVAGVPAVCYDIEWHRELVRNGEMGFLVNEGDIGGLTDAVAYLLDHPAEAQAMGQRAQKVAISKHGLSQTSEIKKRCYKELLQMG